MVLYYDGPDARVTDAVFEVWRPCHQRFRVRELFDVSYSVSSPDRASVQARTVCVGTLVLVVACWPLLRTPLDWMAALFAVAVPAIVQGVLARMRRPQMALYARYQGYQVELYSSTDSRVFGQVRRALVRSLEGTGR